MSEATASGASAVLARDVLRVWFGEPDARGEVGFRREWFTVDPAFDRAIGDRFGAAMRRAIAGELDAMAEDAHGALALILLLDQLPRNVCRGTAAAFAGDERARVIADRAIARGSDRTLPTLMRLFFYLPFEHSEHLADQDRACQLIGGLGDPGVFAYADRHRAVIRRFGRFPHRNAALGRTSTPEEEAFLAEPGSSF